MHLFFLKTSNCISVRVKLLWKHEYFEYAFTV